LKPPKKYLKYLEILKLGLKGDFFKASIVENKPRFCVATFTLYIQVFVDKNKYSLIEIIGNSVE